MNVGEMITAITRCACRWNGDSLLLLKGLDSVEITRDNHILICFTDGNTEDDVIDINGNLIKEDKSI